MLQRRVPTNKLKDDMILGKSIMVSNGLTLVREGTVITPEIRTLLCRHFIDEVIINMLEEGEEGEKKSEKESSKQVDTEADFIEFQKNFKEAAQQISTRIENIVLRGEVNTNELIGLLDEIIGEQKNSINICNMLYKMKQTSNSVYSHSVSVALVAQLMAKRKNMSKEDIEIVVLGALLHDIGLLKIPEAIVNKSEMRTLKEQMEYEKHSILGFQLVKDKNIDQRVKQVVLTHHERMDGTGYPLKVYGENINRFSRLIAIVDAYDSMISNRPGRRMLTPFDVMRNFESDGYHKFDTMILIDFISMMEDSFIHQKVLLSTGEIGEVIMMNRAELSRPLVKVGMNFYDLSIRKNIQIIKMI